MKQALLWAVLKIALCQALLFLDNDLFSVLLAPGACLASAVDWIQMTCPFHARCTGPDQLSWQIKIDMIFEATA